jgi:hypothetical protein
MLFPRPTSSRTLVRETLAATTTELGHILAVEIEALLAEEALAKTGKHEKVVFVGEHSDETPSPKEKRVRNIAQKVLNVAVCGQYSCRLDHGLYLLGYLGAATWFEPLSPNRQIRTPVPVC